jgi:hypothetical protein
MSARGSRSERAVPVSGVRSCAGCEIGRSRERLVCRAENPAHVDASCVGDHGRDYDDEQNNERTSPRKEPGAARRSPEAVSAELPSGACSLGSRCSLLGSFRGQQTDPRSELLSLRSLVGCGLPSPPRPRSERLSDAPISAPSALAWLFGLRLSVGAVEEWLDQVDRGGEDDRRRV